MKNSSKIAIALSAVGIIGLGIAGKSVAEGWKERGFGDRGMGSEMIFDTFDRDADGALTRAEIDGFVAEQMAANDASGNNALDLAEFEGVFAVLTKTPMVRAFQKLDKDGDGEITQAEIDAPLNQAFAMADRNEDGMIEADELRRHGRRGEGERHHEGEGENEN